MPFKVVPSFSLSKANYYMIAISECNEFIVKTGIVPFKWPFFHFFPLKSLYEPHITYPYIKSVA